METPHSYPVDCVHTSATAGTIVNTAGPVGSTNGVNGNTAPAILTVVGIGRESLPPEPGTPGGTGAQAAGVVTVSIDEISRCGLNAVR